MDKDLDDENYNKKANEGPQEKAVVATQEKSVADSAEDKTDQQEDNNALDRTVQQDEVDGAANQDELDGAANQDEEGQQDKVDETNQEDKADDTGLQDGADGRALDNKATVNPARDDEAQNFFQAQRQSQEHDSPDAFCTCDSPDVVEEKKPFKPPQADDSSSFAPPASLVLANKNLAREGSRGTLDIHSKAEGGRGSFLVVFDFDHTLVDANSDLEVQRIHKSGPIPEKLKVTAKEMGWTMYMQEVFRFHYGNQVDTIQL